MIARRFSQLIKIGLAPGALAAALFAGGVTVTPLIAAERFVPGELVIRMQPGHNIETINVEYGSSVRQRLPLLDVYLLSIAGENLDSIAGVIAATPEVEFCHPNYVIDPLQPVQSSLPVSDARPDGSFTSQTSNTQLRLDSTHFYATGNNIRVAVLDGGVNYLHQELAEVAVSGYDYVDNDPDAFDEIGGVNSGHGTFVSGVITLVAPDAEVRGYRVTNTGGESDGYLVAEAIMQAVADGCRVINLSMVAVEPHLAIAVAAQHAADNDVIVIAAAGNGQSSDPHYPASDANVLGVAAIDTLNLLADFSSFGDHVDLCAPGTSLYGPYLDSSYVVWGGTSFAAPFVAAQAALLLSYDPGATRTELLDALISTANSIDHLNPSFSGQLGAGLIDPLASVLAIRGPASILNVPSGFPTIQSAIDAALDGDTILVAPGEYSENLQFGTKAIAVVSELGAEHTTLRQPVGGGVVATMGASFSPQLLRGFTITDVSNSNAIFIDFFGATVSENIFTGNSGSGNRIEVNAYGASTVISRNIFHDNLSNSSINIAYLWRVDGHISILNNTFVRESVPIRIQTTNINNPPEIMPVSITNNLISSSGVQAIFFGDLPPERFEYNLIHDSELDDKFAEYLDSSSQVFADPELLCADCPDFRLLPTSPAIDAGDPDTLFNDPDGTRNDIGAKPGGSVGLPTVIQLSLEDRNTDPPTFNWTYVDTAGLTQQSYQMQLGTDNDWTVSEIWDSGPISSTDEFATYGGPQLAFATTQYLRLRLNNGSEWGEWTELSFLLVDDHVIRVPAEVASLQRALDIALYQDTVLVAAGSYTDPIVIRPEGVVVMSEDGAATTILETAVYGDPMVTFGAGGDSTMPTILSGFTIQNSAIGIKLENTVGAQIRDCEIISNVSKGISAKTCFALVIENCRFDQNFGPLEVTGGTCRFDSNLVINSRGYGDINCIYFGSAVVTARYNIIARNDCSSGMFLGSGNPTVYKNTIYGTTGTGLLIESGNGRVFDNLVVFNGEYGIHLNSQLSNAEIDYNNSFGNVAGDRMGFSNPSLSYISDDPLLLDTTVTTFLLGQGSPCVDAGDPDPQFNDPDSTRGDIGAVVGPRPIGPFIRDLFIAPLDEFGFVNAATPTFSWINQGLDSTAQEQYQIQIGTDGDWSVVEVWDSGPVYSEDTAAVYGGIPLADFTTHIVRVRVHDGIQWGPWWSRPFALKIGSLINVPSAATTIQSAINLAHDGDTILVAPGEYDERIHFLGKAILVTSSDGAELTTITGNYSGTEPVVYIPNGNDGRAQLRGFTIEGGSSYGVNSGAHVTIADCIIRDCSEAGISVGNQSVKVEIRDCTIENNNRGVYLRCDSATVVGNRIVGNTYLWGGAGVYLHARYSYFAHNLIADNAQLNEASGYGAGLWVNSGVDLRFINNTFYGNSIPYGAGSGAAVYMYANSSTKVDFRNNIVAENGPGSGVFIASPANKTFEYNCVHNNTPSDYQGVTPGTGSIDADPMFVDAPGGDFRLQAGSPCINTGDPSFQYIEFDGSIADMGAFGTGNEAVYPFASDIYVAGESLQGLVSDNPTFAWTYEDTTASPQQAYEFQVSAVHNNWVDSLVWGSDSVNSGDQFAVYAGLPLVEGSDYFARVRVHNGTEWGGWHFVALYINTPPPVPLTEFPLGPGIFRKDFNLVSLPSPDADGDILHFDFDFATDSAFSNITFSAVGQSVRFVHLDTTLDWGSNGWWRVRATDGFESSDWSVGWFRMAEVFGEMRLQMADSAEVPCGITNDYTIEMVLPEPGVVSIVVNNFVVSSPDGAVFDSIATSWVSSGFSWSTYFTTGRSLYIEHGEFADTAGFVGTASSGNGYPYTEPLPIWKISTAVDCDFIGKQICFDSSSVRRHYKDQWLMEFSPTGGDPVFYIPSWNGPFCFTIGECCDGLRGDASGDGGDMNIIDITYLIAYIFQGGPEPGCFEEANFDGDPDDRITIADVTSMISYLFSGGAGTVYSCGEYAGGMALRQAPNSAPELFARYSGDSTVIWLSTQTSLKGLQIAFSGSRTADPVSLVGEGIELFYGDSVDAPSYGLLDKEGVKSLPDGEYAVLSIPGQLEPLEAIAADEQNRAVLVKVVDSPAALPKHFALHQNYPNPFNPATQIAFDLPRPANVRLEVFNILGQKVTTLVDGRLEGGAHQVRWDGINNSGSEVASGVYLYRIKAGSFTASKTMLLVK